VKPKPLTLDDEERERALPRFLGHVAAEGSDDCWEWVGQIHPLGYGHFTLAGRGVQRAHRVAYALLVGPLGEDLTIDHRCRNRGCVNPAHLEPVSFAENLRRRRTDVLGKDCPKGHPFVPRGEGNMRSCKTCYQEYQREYLKGYRARKRQEAQEREAS
jgi:hypothetical protein